VALAVSDADLALYQGDAAVMLPMLATGAAECAVTSPPYLDARPEYPSPTPRQWARIFHELRRVVTGPLVLNVGRIWRDGIERQWWRELIDLAALAGFPLLDTLIWLKPNANPIQGSVVTDAHEYVFLLGEPGTRFNVDELRTPYSEETLARYGRRFLANAGVKDYERPPHRPERVGKPNELGARPTSYVYAVTGRAKGNPHPAPMPLDLADYLVRLASFPGDTVIDPFAGSGTTLYAARRLQRRAIGIELNANYCAIAAERTRQLSLLA